MGVIACQPVSLSACALLLALAAPASADPIKLRIACTATSDCASAMVARRRGHLRQTWDRRRRHADRDQHQHSACDRLQLDPDRRTNGDGISAGGRRRTRSRRGRWRLGDGPHLQRIDRGRRAQRSGYQRSQGFRRQKGRRARHRRLPRRAVPQMADGKGRRPKERQFRRSDVPDHERRAEIRRRSTRSLTAEPFISRIKAAGNGEVAAHYASDLARTDPIISYVATRAFADAESGSDQGVPRLDR